jgi:gamma-glutamyl hercynylcysteine S-oxide synthase
MINALPITIDSPAMRQAGPELLSLALMDARNHTLHLVDQIAQALGDGLATAGAAPGLNSPLWTLGHVGWFQEWWLGRNLQRHLGPASDGTAARLASVESNADRWWQLAQAAQSSRMTLDLPDLAHTKGYLLETLESTLDLLDRAPDDDPALYFYRLALFHEDMQGEALMVAAQALGVPLTLMAPGVASPREALLVPAMRWQLGSAALPGFSFDNERLAHEVLIPEFEIDAQAVTWAQLVEFVEDGGYDRAELWQPVGWEWLQTQAAAEGRRGPRYVEQIGGPRSAVLQTRFGKPTLMLGAQPANHLSWWEADAWCRWAGRRLPSEVEWEAAAHTAARRGFRWGDVWEWTGTTFRPYPGFSAGPWRSYSEPHFGTHKVLRGASFATRARMKHPKFRYAALPESDAMFAGFRSCAL